MINQPNFRQFRSLHSKQIIIIIVADIAASRKTEKYSSLSSTYVFEPTAVENHGTFSSSTLNFLLELGRRISSQSGDVRESSYLLQRILLTT